MYSPVHCPLKQCTVPSYTNSLTIPIPTYCCYQCQLTLFNIIHILLPFPRVSSPTYPQLRPQIILHFLHFVIFVKVDSPINLPPFLPQHAAVTLHYQLL